MDLIISGRCVLLAANLLPYALNKATGKWGFWDCGKHRVTAKPKPYVFVNTIEARAKLDELRHSGPYQDFPMEIVPARLDAKDNPTDREVYQALVYQFPEAKNRGMFTELHGKAVMFSCKTGCYEVLSFSPSRTEKGRLDATVIATYETFLGVVGHFTR